MSNYVVVDDDDDYDEIGDLHIFLGIFRYFQLWFAITNALC